MNRLLQHICGTVVLTAAVNLSAATLSIDVDAGKPGSRISPTLWGIFFEDINFGGDGGLYPELVKNRSFEFPDRMMGWREIQQGTARGSARVMNTDPFHQANPHYLQLHATSAGFAVWNEGFRGMGLRQWENYTFSAQLRAKAGGATTLQVELVAPDGRVLAQAKVRDLTPQWKSHSVKLRPSATEAKATLRITLEAEGTIDLDMVSLYPERTFKNRPNGLHADVAQLLADLKPGLMRFPGGCIVEGHWLTNRYQWKTTIGDLPERKLIMNRWNDEFKHRPTPDYYQSFGLGFFEFFQFCEDIGTEPLPILNCGMACQFNSKELAPMDQLDPYIQDAIDLIEFANGPATSPWGAKRAAMGHPAPFNMKFLGVGNEQWGPQYIERYAAFAKVLKAKHPEIKLISSSGPAPNDERFHFAWPKLRELNADIVDEHCYDKPAWFFNSASRYDSYPRTGPKVFMGEYAAQSDKTVSIHNRNNWECALSEAAFMTGLERNADVVVMSAYAPLTGHIDAWQWRPNLIWFDNLRCYGTPNYYVQQLFSRNRGDVVLPTRIAGQEPATAKQPGLYATAVRDEQAGQIILKVVNSSPQPATATVRIAGTNLGQTAEVTLLTANKLSDENSFEDPRKVAPVTTEAKGISPEFTHAFKPWSLTILRLDAAK